MKAEFKNEAIFWRRKGLSYSEILKRVPVAKSTLSLWLRSIGLARRQKQRLTKRRLAAARRGGQAKKQQRLISREKIKQEAALDITEITGKDLWLIGIILYWAEGSKEKEHKPGSGVLFSNSDPLMIKMFLCWLKKCLLLEQERIILEIYLHENHKNDIEFIKKYWSDITGFPVGRFDRIYFKRHKPVTNRKNIGNNYRGLIRIRVTKSSELNRRIAGWIEGICKQCGVV